mmetsp:Transcript_16076/g.39751  ORF Transcript_16076/g.39751 Transcript_16076/m.39751 type:complete len:104 (-) Transcript_16076:1621-1932(-)
MAGLPHFDRFGDVVEDLVEPDAKHYFHCVSSYVRRLQSPPSFRKSRRARGRRQRMFEQERMDQELWTSPLLQLQMRPQKRAHRGAKLQLLQLVRERPAKPKPK